MEINPYESRLRMLQQIDGVQMQREAAPDEETAGCPGCPYFWTCPVPHRGEEVTAPAEIELEDVRDDLGPRKTYRPRDETDVGWTDHWVDANGHRVELGDGHDDAATDNADSAENQTEVIAAPEVPTERAADGSEDSVPQQRGRRRVLRRSRFRRRD